MEVRDNVTRRPAVIEAESRVNMLFILSTAMFLGAFLAGEQHTPTTKQIFNMYLNILFTLLKNKKEGDHNTAFYRFLFQAMPRFPFRFHKPS